MCGIHTSRPVWARIDSTPDINPALAGSDTKVGINLRGGIEYFFTRRATMTGEFLFHKLDGFASPIATFGDGSFWSFAVCGKKYF